MSRVLNSFAMDLPTMKPSVTYVRLLVIVTSNIVPSSEAETLFPNILLKRLPVFLFKDFKVDNYEVHRNPRNLLCTREVNVPIGRNVLISDALHRAIQGKILSPEDDPKKRVKAQAQNLNQMEYKPKFVATEVSNRSGLNHS